MPLQSCLTGFHPNRGIPQVINKYLCLEFLISYGNLLDTVPSHIPEDKKQEVISRWLKGDPRETISSVTGLSAIVVTVIINEWKRELGSAVIEAYKGLGSEMIDKDSSSADIVGGIRLMQVLKRLGVESADYENFLDDFHKFCISSGASPEGLANIAKQVFQLAKLDGITIYQAPAHVENLRITKNELQNEIEGLHAKKEALEQELLLEEQNYNRIKENFSELATVKDQLSKYNLSLNDVSNLAGMINNVRNYGYDATRVVDLIFNLESLEQERVEKDSQIRKMRNSEDTLKASLQQLEQALSAQQAKLESLEKVRRLGFDFRELELIHHITNKIAKHQGTDPASSKNRLFHDIEQYYNDEDDFRKRLHDTEVLLHDRQKELDTLQKNYQDKKDVIDLLERLSSRGINERAFLKYQIINEIFKIDLDSLSEDMTKYGNLSNVVKELEENKSRLEQEELLLRHKLAALEDQRQHFASLLNDLMTKRSMEKF
jgi:hypothetical protein